MSPALFLVVPSFGSLICYGLDETFIVEINTLFLVENRIEFNHFIMQKIKTYGLKYFGIIQFYKLLKFIF